MCLAVCREVIKASRIICGEVTEGNKSNITLFDSPPFQLPPPPPPLHPPTPPPRPPTTPIQPIIT